MRKVHAIAVYSPSDAVESAVQDASHRYSGEWLNSHACQLVARAIGSLKIFDDWLENSTVLAQRVAYLFEPHMSSQKDRMVFVTHPLFLRDIVENNEINLYNHDPIVLVTTPIAHYLFREYPIHIHLDVSKLKELNDRAKWLEVGGLIISDDKSIAVDETAIIGIHKPSELKKVAAVRVGPEVFRIEEHRFALKPGAEVWDKKERESATVIEVEPGETGMVIVRYMNGNNKSVPKTEFDQCFSRTGPQSGNEVFDAEYNKHMEVTENE